MCLQIGPEQRLPVRAGCARNNRLTCKMGSVSAAAAPPSLVRYASGLRISERYFKNYVGERLLGLGGKGSAKITVRLLSTGSGHT